MTTGFSTQAYMWMGIYDSQHEKNVLLEKELTRTQQELRRKDEDYLDAPWTLHELSNGAGHAAVNLYQQGQLQEIISYETRDRIQARLWRAESAMNRERAHEMYTARQ